MVRVPSSHAEETGEETRDPVFSDSIVQLWEDDTAKHLLVQVNIQGFVGVIGVFVILITGQSILEAQYAEEPCQGGERSMPKQKATGHPSHSMPLPTRTFQIKKPGKMKCL